MLILKMPPVVFELPVDLNKLYCKSISYLSDRVSSFGWGSLLVQKLTNKTKQKKHCVHFPLSLLFCNHLCKLTAKILISEHLPHAKISQQKNKQKNHLVYNFLPLSRCKVIAFPSHLVATLQAEGNGRIWSLSLHLHISFTEEKEE